MHLKTLSAKQRPFCLGLNVLNMLIIGIFHRISVCCRILDADICSVQPLFSWTDHQIWDKIDGLVQERCHSSTLAMQRSWKGMSYSPKRYFSLVGQVTVTWHSSDGRADNNCTNKLYSPRTSRHLVSDKCWCHVTCPKYECFSNFTATSANGVSLSCTNPLKWPSLCKLLHIAALQSTAIWRYICFYSTCCMSVTSFTVI